MKTSRRNFLKRASTVVAALALCPAVLIPKEEFEIEIKWSGIKTILLTDQLDPNMNGVYGIATCHITVPSGTAQSWKRIEAT